MNQEKIEIIEPVAGFTEREKDSKALLNTDLQSLLRYKIQRRKFSEININNLEMNNIKGEINNLKNDLSEIKELLLKITKE